MARWPFVLALAAAMTSCSPDKDGNVIPVEQEVKRMPGKFRIDEAYSPRLDNDGSTVVFTKPGSRGDTDVYWLKLDNPQEYDLADSPESDSEKATCLNISNTQDQEYNPDISGEGTRVVYASRSDSLDQVILVDLKQGSRDTLASYPIDGKVLRPFIDRDGNYSAYVIYDSLLVLHDLMTGRTYRTEDDQDHLRDVSFFGSWHVNPRGLDAGSRLMHIDDVAQECPERLTSIARQLFLGHDTVPYCQDKFTEHTQHFDDFPVLGHDTTYNIWIYACAERALIARTGQFSKNSFMTYFPPDKSTPLQFPEELIESPFTRHCLSRDGKVLASQRTHIPEPGFIIIRDVYDAIREEDKR